MLTDLAEPDDEEQQADAVNRMRQARGRSNDQSTKVTSGEQKEADACAYQSRKTILKNVPAAITLAYTAAKQSESPV